MLTFEFDPVIFGFAVAGIIIILCIIAIAVLMWSQVLRTQQALQNNTNAQTLEAELAELKGRLQSLADITVTRQSEVSRNLHERLDKMSHNLGRNLSDSAQKTSENLTQLQERIAVIDSAQDNLTKLSGQVVTLQNILSNKQARGAFGQVRMETIIQDGLAQNSYTFQPTLSNGKRPDCLIHLPNNPAGIVIDAKFPLEGFEAFRNAQQETERKEAMKYIRQHVGTHIDDISQKYFLPGETQDTAIMFIPSEALYADIHEFFPDIVQKAYRARIIIAAPNMLMLAVQTIQSIMKDVQMREAAGLIKQEVTKLTDDIHRLQDRVLNLQRHFGQANKDIDQILTSADKISSRGRRIETLDFDREAENLAQTATKAKDISAPPEVLAGE
ncbi:MAG: DNA recombination protein RmuC [Pseudomonadota bacterium]